MKSLFCAENFADSYRLRMHVSSDIQGASRTEIYTSGMAPERTGRIAGVRAGWRLSESRAQGSIAG